MARRKLYSPKLGQPGSWGRLPDGTVVQVWAPAPCEYAPSPGHSRSPSRRRRSREFVWAVDGDGRAHKVVTSELQPLEIFSSEPLA